MAAFRSASRAWVVATILLGAFGCGERTQIQRAKDAPPEPYARGERTIQPGEWIMEPLKLEKATDVRLNATVLSGPAVDLYVMTEAGLQRWSSLVKSVPAGAEEDFETVPMLGLQGLSAAFTSEWTALTPGTYYLVLDNTPHGGTAPPAAGNEGAATVNFTVETRVPPQ